MADIHPSALVDPGARLGEGVRVGPFCVVGADVAIGNHATLMSHVVVEGRTEIGARSVMYPFASIGHRPQDLKFAGEPSTVCIGSDCTIREGVTVNPGTRDGGSTTIVGDRCTLMAQAHVGHDCHVGDDVVLSNNVMLAGHVSIGAHAILGGGVGVHQFVRVGEMAFVGGLSGLEGDLVPFGMAVGNRARLSGLNLVGLRRQGVARETVKALSEALASIFASGGVLADRLDFVAGRFAANTAVMRLIGFLRDAGTRPLCRPDPSAGAAARPRAASRPA